MSISDKFKDHILDSIAEGVFTVDKNFKIIYFNKAAEDITGYKRDEVLGKFCKHVFRSELCFTDCPIALALKSNKQIYDFESNIQTKTGTKKPIKLNSAVLRNEEEEPTGGIVSFRDISDYEVFKKSLEKTSNYHGVIGNSKEMQDIFNLIEEIKDSNAPVLIQGESGTGKEMIANAIQASSIRKNEAFVKVNCSVFPSNLLASELFGHIKGSFTDAIKDRPGRFEIADKGTLFLDEVAEMPLQTQLQLLRVLQEGTFERVGESVTRKVNVRIIAATNLDLNDALKKQKFREDLFYRLNVIPILIPPLRERLSDIRPLVDHFLQKYSLIYDKEITEIDDTAMDILLSYDWPGNIRQLENIIEYAFVRTINKNIIEAQKLPSVVKTSTKHNFSIVDETEEVNDEKIALLKLLEKHHWNKTTAAAELGIGRTTLWRKLKKYNLDE